jgi:hypothetical protein
VPASIERRARPAHSRARDRRTDFRPRRLAQIDEYCASVELSIVGYYHANERRADTEIGHIARKIGERLHARFSSAIIALVDNSGLGAAAAVSSKPALTAYALAGNVWTALASNAVTLTGADAAIAALSAMVASGKQHAVDDFDSHLDDVSRPWLDQKLPR